MRIISLKPVGQVERSLLAILAEDLTQRLRVACSIQPDSLEIDFAFNPLRRQYSSTEILKKILPRSQGQSWTVLGVTDMDLYIPVLTFVFGEAQLDKGGAVVSAHRLHQEFYGLPGDPELLRQRLFKESLHELGHTFGLRHCFDYNCVMSSSNGVERIDLKNAEFCASCTKLIPGS